jgi:ribulose-5-phosphate 4-epimerase/fuculose-1-phosphate aldolase
MSGAFEMLALASRILARENVTDAFGHVSLRNPDCAEQYLISCSRSPELVAATDIMSLELNGTSAHPDDRRAPVLERFIHGAVYEARPDIHCVVHAHCEELLPFSVTGTELRPLIHMAGALGSRVPLWDSATHFGDTNLLVTDMARGRNLAAALDQHSAILMRGHGVTVVGRSVQEAVLAAIYLKLNARIDLAARTLGVPQYLSPEEAALCTGNLFGPTPLERAWDYYSRRALHLRQPE